MVLGKAATIPDCNSILGNEMLSAPDFQSTWLWRHAFVHLQSGIKSEEQEFFKNSYFSLRERASQLVSRISAELPSLTVHDVTHLDALWDTASIVSEDAISLTPAEAYVFGGAALLHDAGMTLAAYPGGIADLKETIIWKDIVARIQQNAQEPISASDAEDAALPVVLRQLHAVQAASLATQGWKTDAGDWIYLIDDPEVRAFYGPLIGEIAHSHWWSTARVESDFSQDFGALPQRTKSLIDRVKVACLLRVADALHLDQRRAPRFLHALVKPQGIAEQHWAFQEKLAAPHVEGDAVVFTGSPFDLSDADAWWLAFDILGSVDRELNEVDLILQNRGRGALKARRVKAVRNPDALARLIPTAGWRPVEANIRVSDVPKIINALGGAKLYGDAPAVAIRELIQNACDAINARRILQNRSDTWGHISVVLEDRNGEYWLTIEDVGVGMSEQVATGPLIDFGSSLWKSTLAVEEFPGLVAKGMRATGKFGIGFFSTFMLGSFVRVVTRRFDKSVDEARVIEFRNGTASRPIVYVPNAEDAPIDGGTRIEVRLKMSPTDVGGFLEYNGYEAESYTLAQVVSSLAPSVNVSISTNDASGFCVNANDWMSIKNNTLLSRIDKGDEDYLIPYSKRVRPLSDKSGKIYGRAYIAEWWRSDGCVTVGGLRAGALSQIRGLLLGEAVTASRNVAIPSVPADVLAKWATQQARLADSSSGLDDEAKASVADTVLECGGNAGKLSILRWGESWLNSESILKRLAKVQKIFVSFEEFTYEEELDDVLPRDFNRNLKLHNNVVSIPKRRIPILKVGDDEWPLMMVGSRGRQETALQRHFLNLLDRSWGTGFTKQNVEIEIGAVNETAVSREVTMFSRLTEKKASAKRSKNER